jgi:hypothetical protein
MVASCVSTRCSDLNKSRDAIPGPYTPDASSAASGTRLVSNIIHPRLCSMRYAGKGSMISRFGSLIPTACFPAASETSVRRAPKVAVRSHSPAQLLTLSSLECRTTGPHCDNSLVLPQEHILGYCRDTLFRPDSGPDRYVHLTSSNTRQAHNPSHRHLAEISRNTGSRALLKATGLSDGAK